jgi:hypothetical protein
MAEEREARFRALYEAARPRIVACAISCPSANACVALGVSDQGSASTPVYSFVAESTP